MEGNTANENVSRKVDLQDKMYSVKLQLKEQTQLNTDLRNRTEKVNSLTFKLDLLQKTSTYKNRFR